ncbi:MAG: glutamate ABC transporter substrate-binding protein [Mycobacterium sp.]|nr:glutamate ABC transporter substrate-binding protein [Mycobacterium sp.]
MKVRLLVAALEVAFTAGCGGTPATPAAVTVPPVDVRPAGVQEVTTVPPQAAATCGDPEASLRPGPQPAPGAMPAGSTMAAIADRGRLIVGVDQDSYPFGSRNPTTGQLEGFDIDVAREIARAIFGDPDRIELKVITPAQRQSALEFGQVDLVVRTYSITCDRKRSVDFSSTYFSASQRILVRKDSGIDSAAALYPGKKVCSVFGTTSVSRVAALEPRPTVIGVNSWTDCLLMLQQAQVDAISTDDAVLAGLAVQDPNVEIVGASMGSEPYGVGVKKENSDLVRFVNGVLARMRADGTWEVLYNEHLLSLGPSPGPPQARYLDGP